MSGQLLHNKHSSDYSILLNSIPLVIYHFLPGHKLVYANDSFFNFFKLTADQVLNKPFFPPVHPYDSQIFDQVFESLSQELTLNNFTCRIKFSENDIRWTEWKIIPLKDDKGSFLEYQAIITDLTERKKTELALKQSEQQYKLAFEQAADMIVIIDRMGNFLDLNKKFELESGWKKEEMIGKNVFTSRIVTNESAQRIISYLNKLLSGNDVPAFEIQGIRKDGKIIDYEIHAVPIIKDSVNITFQAILRNISRRKVIEEALRKSQRQLSNLMSNLPGMAYKCAFDEKWTMEFVSGGSFELTGYPPDALIENNLITYGDLIIEEDRAGVFSNVKQAIDENKTFRLNYRIRTADGSIRWVWEQGIGVKNDNGEVDFIEGFISDITDQKIIQESLRENEELYRKLISTLPDMIVITDIDGNILFMNEQGIKISGYASFTDVKKKNVLDFIVDDDKERAVSNLTKMVDRTLGPTEYTFINKDGSRIDFEVNGEVLRNQDNTPYGFIFSCREVTTRKLAEEALAQSEEQYRTLVDSMQDGVFLIQNGRLNFVNQAFAKIAGYSVEELFDLDFSKLVAPEDLDLVLGNYKRRLAGEDVPSSYEWRMLHKDTSRVYVNMSIRLINYKGNIASIGTLKDITLGKKMEVILNRQKNLLSAAAEASNILLTETDFKIAIEKTLSILGEKTSVDRVYIFENSTDEKSGLHYMSQRYEWVREKVSAQIENQDLQMLPYIPVFSDWYDLFSNGEYVWSLSKDLPQDQKKIMEDEEILSILEVPVKIKNQLWGFIGFDDCHTEREWTESEISILKAAAGSIGGAIERERTNIELISAKEKAEDMNRLKSNFLANMSHELRTPLIAILGYAELLALDAVNKESKAMLETIYSGGVRLLETLNHLLDLSKIEADKVNIYPEPADVIEIINEVFALFNTLALKKGLYLNVKSDSERLLCELDKRLLRTILNNLVGNALKFTNQGGITVEARIEKSSDDLMLTIKVSDTGIGITESSRKIIFDEFRQISEGYNRQFEGTGLGLTITKKFVELLNGSIDFNSETGKGTTFIVTIPVTEAKTSKARSVIETKELLIESPGEKKKVIFVDDDPASRSVMSFFMRKEYDVEVAATGEEAMIMMQQNHYDLILLDISMGKGINGLDLVKLLRTKEMYSKLPVMAVTAHAMVGDKERFLSEGFDDYIAKPFSKIELMKKIKLLLENNRYKDN